MKLIGKNICTSYGSTEILHHLNFSIELGQSVCILGNNGCGKTTLLKTICGVLPHEGDLFFDDRSVSHWSRRQYAKYFAMLPQFSRSYFDYTVEQTVRMGRYVHDMSDTGIVAEVMAKTGIEDLKDRTLNTLSGGQLQRVLLARTLAQEAPILLLDEPMNHLDLKMRSEWLDLLQEWMQGKEEIDGRIIPHTLIAVFHDLEAPLTIGDDFLFLKDGCLLAHMAKEQLPETIWSSALGIDIRQYAEQQQQLWEDLYD